MQNINAKTNSAPGLEGRILRVLGVCLIVIMLLAVPLVNYYGDASGMYHAEGEPGSPIAVADALMAGQNVENLGNYDERLVRRIVVNNMERKSTVVLGSSRAAMISADMLGEYGEDMFGCGVAAGSIYDVIGFYGVLWQQDKLPDTLVIVMDPWMLNDNYSDSESRWKEVVGDGYCAYLTQRLGIDCDPSLLKVHPLADTDPENDRTTLGNMGKDLFRNLFSVTYFQSSLQSLTKNGTGQSWFTTEDHYGNLGVLRSDGSFCYPFDYRTATAQQKLTQASMTLGNIIGLEDYPSLDTADRALFECFLQQVQKDGVEVKLVMFPLSNILWDDMAGKAEHYRTFFETEAMMRTIAEAAGCDIVGSYDPYSMALDYTSFYDGYHPTDFVVAKVLEQLWEE